jgi:hypothetical protein
MGGRPGGFGQIELTRQSEHWLHRRFPRRSLEIATGAVTLS